MIPSDNVAAPLGFPDLTLAVSYADSLRYAQFRLKMIPRGELNGFCTEHDLPYTTVVNLKNNKQQKEGAHLLQRVLRSLSVETRLVSIPPDSSTSQHYYLFPNPEALATFRAQLSSIDSGNLIPPTTT
jgi:hypothetical protein